MRSAEDFEKFQALGRVRSFAQLSAQMQPVGQKVRIISGQKSIDIDAAGYIQKGLRPQTVCKWLIFVREVLNG